MSGTETIEYEGQYVKDGVTKRTITYDNLGKIISNKTNLDEPEKVLQEIMYEESAEEVTDKGQNAAETVKQSKDVEPKEFQKFKVPKGWSVSDIAKAHGITADEVLQANVNEAGEKAYKTNKKGVNYFLIDQEINLPTDAKFNAEYKPKVRTRAKAGARSGAGLSEADKIRMSAQFTLDAANKTAEAAKNAKLNPKAGLNIGKKKVQAPKLEPEASKAETKPAAPVQPKQAVQAAKEVTKSSNPAVPRDMNPPKQDATSMIIYQAHATGPKNGKLSDINGNIYEYDHKGRLRYFNDNKGGNVTAYKYDDNGKLSIINEWKTGIQIVRNVKGEVLEYYNQKEHIWRYGNGVVSSNQKKPATMEDFNFKKPF